LFPAVSYEEVPASGRPVVDSPLKEIENGGPGQGRVVKGFEEALSEDRELYYPSFMNMAREDWSAKAKEFFSIYLSHAR